MPLLADGEHSRPSEEPDSGAEFSAAEAEEMQQNDVVESKDAQASASNANDQPAPEKKTAAKRKAPAKKQKKAADEEAAVAQEASVSDADAGDEPAPMKKKAAKRKPPAKKQKKGADEDAAEAQEVSADEDMDDEPAPKKKKKAAKPKEPVKPLDPAVPTNTTMPETLEYPRPQAGAVRIASWNVCGINSAAKKGMRTYVDAEDADILVITETKMDDPKLGWLNDRYPHRYWGTDPKKGYAGTAVLSKLEPKNVTYGLPNAGEDVGPTSGRIITLEFENTHVIGTYVPNAGKDLKEMPRKQAWNAAFEAYVRELDAKKPVVWVGDFNVVLTDSDIRNWKTNYEKSAGCTSIEIDGFNSQLNPPDGSGHAKLIDTWRVLHPDTVGHYSYYGYRFQCRSKGIGWRLDYNVVSERLMPRVKQSEIRLDAYGCSDHLPLVIDLEGPL